LAGDFSLLPDSEVIIRTGLMSVVSQPTRGDRYLDRVYVSDLHYSNMKVVKCTVKSDHMAIVAWSGQDKKTISKAKSKRTFRKHTAREHAHFLASVTAPVYSIRYSGDPQDEFDKFCSVLTRLLDTYYPERSVTITSADPTYVTPTVNHMFRKKIN